MTEKPKREVAKAFTIKCYQEDIDRFAAIKDGMEGVNTNPQAFTALMDFYENPKTITVSDETQTARIAELEDELEAAYASAEAVREQLTAKIASETELSAALQLSKSKEGLQLAANQFVVTTNPVVQKFLADMVVFVNTQRTRQGKEPVGPDYILLDLFIKDLQNPRANNLPYTVSSADIRKVMADVRREEETTTTD